MMKIINAIIVIVILGVGIALFVFANNVHSKANVDALPEPLETFCSTDEDCVQHLSYNTCEVYCANKDEINSKILSKLGKTCDATLWDPGHINCVCGENRCLELRNQGYGPMITVVYEPCDIDRDGDCDKRDYELFTNVIGQCIDGENYNDLADADRDGCVTYKDEKIIFLEGAP